MIHSLLYLLAVGLTTLLAYVPRRPAYWLGARLGDLAYLCLKRRRQVTLENLSLALGKHTTVPQRVQLARATFQRLGQHGIDFSRLRRLTPGRFLALCELEGREHLDTLLQRQAGLLIITAHFGSWELAPALALHVPVPIHVIVRPPDHPVLRRLAATHRQRCGYQTITSRQAFAPALHALRQGHIVAVLMDQSHARQRSLPVPFMDAPALTSLGPALLALRSRCPVVGAFLVNTAPGRHRLIITPEIPLPDSGHVRCDVAATTARFTQVIEAYVRRYPDHWFWLHRRWKQR